MKKKVMEKDTICLTPSMINCMKRNKENISHEFYILNKTSTLTDSILTTPRNILQTNSPILAEASEDEECQKIFKKLQEDARKQNRKSVNQHIYDVITNVKYDEIHILRTLATIQESIKRLMKAIQEDDVFKIAGSIIDLRVSTTCMIYFVMSSQPFFESMELLDMYKLLWGAAKIYADQTRKLENLMYEDEKDN